MRELDPWEADVQRQGAEQTLREAALRLMGAAPTGESFAASPGALAELVKNVNAKLGESREFQLSLDVPAGDLPRYTGEWIVWVRPTESGGVRLRAEFFPFLRALVAELSIDGILSEPRVEEGFGVPDDELTPQALKDIAAVEEVRAQTEEEDRREEEPRPAPKGVELLKAVAAPWQDPAGMVVTTVELFADGVWINYVLPAPDPSLLAKERDPDRLEFEAAFPRLKLSDDAGTSYGLGDWGNQDHNTGLVHAAQWFEPAVPSEARYLVIKSDAGSVEIEVGPQ